jgi:predicted protein tyrosine phosphatase
MPTIALERTRIAMIDHNPPRPHAHLMRSNAEGQPLEVRLKPMSGSVVPFKITICGIDELADHCEVGVSHVLSILDPSAPPPPAFGSFAEHVRVELRFDDVIEDLPDHVLPRRRDVEEILAFGRNLAAEPSSNAHLLVHCHMGISRSTAAMTLILAQARPDLSGDEILTEVLRIRSRAWPNLRIVELGDALLGRNGAIVAALPRVYRAQIRLRPELERLFRENGRGREVAKALGVD